jgi:hypothetical protein
MGGGLPACCASRLELAECCRVHPLCRVITAMALSNQKYADREARISEGRVRRNL